jgi:DNA replication protein DnaD
LFRLVPDPAEISNAIQLTTESNRKEFTTNFGFEGVPVYQVESLYVKLASGTMRATPLFLSKESAEISLSYTCETKKKHIDPNLKELVNKTKTDIDKAKYAFESLRKPDVLQTQQKSALPRKFNQHEESEELSRRQSKRFTTSNSTNSETISEVGSLEWVIQQMEQDCVGIWSEIIFIPPGIVNLEKKHK